MESSTAASAGLGKLEPVTKLCMYGIAPMFASPAKLAMHALVGRRYERAYEHFRRDHQSPLNLLLHCGCLCYQLSFNFSFASQVGICLDGGSEKEEGFWTEGVPAATNVAWTWTLLCARGMPLGVRVAAISCVVLAYKGRDLFREKWRRLAYVTGALEMVAAQVFLVEGAKGTSGAGRRPLNVPQLLAMVAGRLALQGAVERSCFGCLSGDRARRVVNYCLYAFMAMRSQDPFGAKSLGGTKGTPFAILGFLGWLPALLTDQPWIYLNSGGWMASLLQGCAHHYSYEEGTLPQLADAADELSHATYFPALLLHSVYQSLRWGRGPALKLA